MDKELTLIFASIDHLNKTNEQLGDQLTALTTVVRVLIETHPDRQAVAEVLDRSRLRLEAELGPTELPDRSIAAMLHLIDQMKTIALRSPEPPTRGGLPIPK